LTIINWLTGLDAVIDALLDVPVTDKATVLPIG
jgi:hypothetical protein